ncbi:MAG: response regulator transcription factor [Candidatus Latescibacteria bacterium]|jgi:DNA-binding NarL/FixJ family response regulator|nr:response regulator transcription factor [Candidatus Latescibacterota bacterium]
MSPIRVVIADDHALVRSGIRALLEAAADIHVVAEAGDGREAVAQVQSHEPDVVLMDVAMPGLNGFDAALRVREDAPETRVIILSMHTSEEYVLRALRVGASGYLLKEAETGELETAIRTVARGETYLSPPVSRFVADYVRRTGGDVESTPLERLTIRQREILQLIAEGNTNRQIAEKLHISQKTVETHRTQMMNSLDIHDVAGLVRFAVRAGLVSSNS